MIPMYRVLLHGLYGLYGPCCPLSPERPLNLIIHSLKYKSGTTPTSHELWAYFPVLIFWNEENCSCHGCVAIVNIVHLA